MAKSFERIYRQNADNIGLYTSTDFGLVTRLEAGEPIPIDDLVAGRDALAASILKHGGLLKFGQQYLTRVQPAGAVDDQQPQTLFEKIVRRNLLSTPVTPAHPNPGDGIFVQAHW